MGKDTFYIQEEKIEDQQPPAHVCTLQKYIEGHNGQAITPFEGLLEGTQNSTNIIILLRNSFSFSLCI